MRRTAVSACRKPQVSPLTYRGINKKYAIPDSEDTVALSFLGVAAGHTSLQADVAQLLNGVQAIAPATPTGLS